MEKTSFFLAHLRTNHRILGTIRMDRELENDRLELIRILEGKSDSKEPFDNVLDNSELEDILEQSDHDTDTEEELDFDFPPQGGAPVVDQPGQAAAAAAAAGQQPPVQLPVTVLDYHGSDGTVWRRNPSQPNQQHIVDQAGMPTILG